MPKFTYKKQIRLPLLANPEFTATAYMVVANADAHSIIGDQTTYMWRALWYHVGPGGGYATRQPSYQTGVLYTDSDQMQQIVQHWNFIKPKYLRVCFTPMTKKLPILNMPRSDDVTAGPVPYATPRLWIRTNYRYEGYDWTAGDYQQTREPIFSRIQEDRRWKSFSCFRKVTVIVKCMGMQPGISTWPMPGFDDIGHWVPGAQPPGYTWKAYGPVFPMTYQKPKYQRSSDFDMQTDDAGGPWSVTNGSPVWPGISYFVSNIPMQGNAHPWWQRWNVIWDVVLAVKSRPKSITRWEDEYTNHTAPTIAPEGWRGGSTIQADPPGTELGDRLDVAGGDGVPLDTTYEEKFEGMEAGENMLSKEEDIDDIEPESPEKTMSVTSPTSTAPLDLVPTLSHRLLSHCPPRTAIRSPEAPTRSLPHRVYSSIPSVRQLRMDLALVRQLQAELPQVEGEADPQLASAERALVHEIVQLEREKEDEAQSTPDVAVLESSSPVKETTLQDPDST